MMDLRITGPQIPHGQTVLSNRPDEVHIREVIVPKAVN